MDEVSLSGSPVHLAAVVRMCRGLQLAVDAVGVYGAALHSSLGGQPDNAGGQEHYAESYQTRAGLNDDSLISERYSCELDLTPCTYQVCWCLNELGAI